ncbi:MAG: hypothetical protein AAFW81_04720 [Pseudomonadota bacterium]
MVPPAPFPPDEPIFIGGPPPFVPPPLIIPPVIVPPVVIPPDDDDDDDDDEEPPVDMPEPDMMILIGLGAILTWRYARK